MEDYSTVVAGLTDQQLALAQEAATRSTKSPLVPFITGTAVVRCLARSTLQCQLMDELNTQ